MLQGLKGWFIIVLTVRENRKEFVIMATFYKLNLLAADVFQILDALNSRAESYEQTAKGMSEPFSSIESALTEDCRDAAEAIEIAKHFREVVKTIEQQIS